MPQLTTSQPTPRPGLRWTSKAAPSRVAGAVLVIHGGASESLDRVRWRRLAVLRLVPFATAVARAGHGRVAVARLRLAVRGWNGAGESAMADARWALAQIRARYPGVPIGIVGHSLGGRIALHLGDEADVMAIVGLAAWVDPGDRPTGGPHTKALLLHGTYDQMTDPRGSAQMAALMRGRGVDAAYEPVEGEQHAFLRRPRQVQERVAAWLVEALLSRRDAPDRTS